jgi:glutathione S-transferase
MSLTFYYAPMSTATVTQLVVEELALPCEKVKIDFSKGDTRKPEYLTLNPNGKVPLLVHDGEPIWESAAITLYLGEVFGVEKGLYPQPGPKRGALMKWVVWSNVSLANANMRWLNNTSTEAPAEQRNAKAGEVALADLHKLLGILNQALEGRQFLGDAYSLADTHVHSVTDWIRFLKVDFSAYAHINAWAERCRARPAYGSVMSSAG